MSREPSATAADGDEGVFLRRRAKGVNTIDAVGTGVERKECVVTEAFYRVGEHSGV